MQAGDGSDAEASGAPRVDDGGNSLDSAANGATGAAGDGSPDPRVMALAALKPILSSPEFKSPAKVDQLRKERQAVSAQKRELSKKMKAETRKVKRLVQKSGRLSNLDLVEVLRLRHEKAQKAAENSRAELTE